MTGCNGASSERIVVADPVLPQYPVAGPPVAVELKKVCFKGSELLCPSLFEWLGRIEKLANKLPQSEWVQK